LQFAYDLMEIMCVQLNPAGKVYEAVVCQPMKFIEPHPALLATLFTLRSKGKLLFLVSDYNREYT
jgi:hypothetical protein